MENNSNAIAEIQKKYAGCNLLMPAATEVQLNRSIVKSSTEGALIQIDVPMVEE